MQKQTFIADKTGRIDRVIADSLPILSRSGAERLISAGNVSVGGVIAAKKNLIVPAGAEITVTLPNPEPMEAEPQNIPLEFAYEDEYLLVVNKPKGMVVHPAPGNRDGTLVNALLYHCGDRLSGINGVMRPGIVHRIDKDTSGLLIVAKTDAAHAGLAAQIERHSFTREYECVCVGRMKEQSGTIDRPVGRHPIDRVKMAIVPPPEGRNAVTHWSVLREFTGGRGGFTHLRCALETGRTHQIRVHLSSVGHPVLGDEVYGGTKTGVGFPTLEGQCLHARRIAFIHPITGETLDFTSELPDYFKDVLNILERLQ